MHEMPAPQNWMQASASRPRVSCVGIAQSSTKPRGQRQSQESSALPRHIVPRSFTVLKSAVNLSILLQAPAPVCHRWQTLRVFISASYAPTILTLSIALTCTRLSCPWTSSTRPYTALGAKTGRQYCQEPRDPSIIQVTIIIIVVSIETL